MGEKDIEEKLLEDYNDVFADIINVLIFNGRKIVKPENLENTKDKSRFKNVDGKVTEQERDVAKRWQNNRIRLALFGVENQTSSDDKICLRLYGYDGAAYKSQYNEDVTYPVITLVLHFDHKHRWKGPKTLMESMEVPRELLPYVNDYHMNLFEIAWLSDDQVSMFTSDFWIVADYFVQMRKNKDYMPSKQTIEHVDAVLKLMSALTGDSRFEVAQNEPNIKERGLSMCEVLDKIENRGEKRGSFEMLLKIVGDYVKNFKMTQKAACEQLSIDYKEYQAAKRYMKKISK
ncbi:MAG: Rpn family recombination-promoting nuclease/putative transposase [Lachnospiraceae bacterium]|nr:Rpn family recombination-promoting nuclease/putative transposase [Lachnospiraceae bacterium]